MSRLGYSIAVGAALVVASTTAQAQIREGTRVGTNYPVGSAGSVYSTQNIPPGQMPPAGMCRIWIDGVPPGRQPAPTDCGTAQRNVPANGRVIYGSQTQPLYPSGAYPAGTVRNGRYDPRLDPRSAQYDPRLDPRNRRYDSRYDPYRNSTSARRAAELQREQQRQYELQREQQRQYEIQQQRQLELQREQQRAQYNASRRAQKEQQKEWKKENKGNGHHDDDQGNGHDRGHGHDH